MQTGRQACVFYASNNTYAVAVLVFVKLLRGHGGVGSYDIVLIHHRLAPGLLEQIKDAGIIPRAATTPLKLPHAYYRDCLLKLRIFELFEYDRIVYVDADAIPLHSFDALLSFDMQSHVAAPLAYWLPHHYWTSGLIVAKPASEIVDRIQRSLATGGNKSQFDMDIINRALADDIQTLPSDYFCLDSEWEVAERPGYFDGRADILDRLLVVHFSTLANPWTLAPRKVRHRRPRASPIYYELRETWWGAMNDVLSGSPRAIRAQFRVSQYLAAFRSR